MSETKLRSCPFCGEKEEIRQAVLYFYCGHCGANGPNDNKYYATEMLAQKWNTRPVEDELVVACEKLIAYRDRCGPLNFQLEKADDFIFKMRVAIAKARGEHEGGAP